MVMGGEEGVRSEPVAVKGKAASVLWAKTEPYYPLLNHLVDVGLVAAAYLSERPALLRRLQEAMDCPSPDFTVRWAAYLAALHDIGKCHNDFQGRAPEDILELMRLAGLDCLHAGLRYRHEAFGASWVMDHLTSGFKWNRRESFTTSLAVRGHHGNFRSDEEVPDPAEQATCWESLRSALEQTLREVFLPGADSWVPSFADHSTAGLLLSGVTILSDWVASNEELLPRTAEGEVLDPGFLALRREQTRSALRAIGFESAQVWSPCSSFAEVWGPLSMNDPRPIQGAVEELCRSGVRPGLAIIEAPMGEGKTEAAIHLAVHWLGLTQGSGIYVALPTAATSNQMYRRFREFLGAHDTVSARSARLVHGMAWLLDEAAPHQTPAVAADCTDPEAEAYRIGEWFRPAKRGLLAPYAVGTVDQALMGVMHVRHSLLRLFGLAGRVLIVDEVHAYDAYTSEILGLLLRWCGHLRIPVVLLSATLPRSRRRWLVQAYVGAPTPPTEESSAYPLITLAVSGGAVRELPVAASSRRTEVKLSQHWGALGNYSECARLVAARAREGGCLAVIANTVDSAQRLYLAVKDELCRWAYPGRTLLFHGRFPPDRRQRIESTVLDLFDKRSLLPAHDPGRTSRPAGAVVVATQVIEQSLDLDFDEIFSEVAPVDLVIQRLGRLHRHSRGKRPTGDQPVVHLFLPEPEAGLAFGPTERVYQRFLLLKTLAALDGRQRLHLPGDIRPLVESVYDDAVEPTREVSGVSRDALEAAWAQLEAQRDDDAAKARQYLLPPPVAESFRAARIPTMAFEESEEGVTSYFRAQTRLGDSSQPVLLLPEEECDSLTARHPSRRILRGLLGRRLNLPGWWLVGLAAAEGYQEPYPAPRWLLGTTTLPLRGGAWRGVDAEGVIWEIRDDAELGVVRQRRKEDENDLERVL